MFYDFSSAGSLPGFVFTTCRDEKVLGTEEKSTKSLFVPSFNLRIIYILKCFRDNTMCCFNRYDKHINFLFQLPLR